MKTLILAIVLAGCGDNRPAPELDAAIAIDAELDAPDAGVPYCAQAGCVSLGFCSSPEHCTCTLADGSMIVCRQETP